MTTLHQQVTDLLEIKINTKIFFIGETTSDFTHGESYLVHNIDIDFSGYNIIENLHKGIMATPLYVIVGNDTKLRWLSTEQIQKFETIQHRRKRLISNV